MGDKLFKRVNSVLCLVVEEARYYEGCYSKCFTNISSSLKRERPKDEHIDSAIEELCRYVDESEDCQFALHHLMRNLEDSIPESSSVTEKTLKNLLMDAYEGRVMFFEVKKRITLVCLLDWTKTHQYLVHKERKESEEEERLKKVNTAATIILEDIRKSFSNTTDYPDLIEFMKNAKDVPETLPAFFN